MFINSILSRLFGKFLSLTGIICCFLSLTLFGAEDSTIHHYLYVAAPGVRNYLEYGGHGLLVFDMDHDFKFVKRIPMGGLDKTGKPSNVKGICANARTHRVYISTLQSLMCIDLLMESLVWEKFYDGGCDRMAISPDGKIIYLPTLEGNDWKVIDAFTGNAIAIVSPHSGSHNTIYGPDGKRVYLAGLKSPYLMIADAKRNQIIDSIGPFSDFIRPFTIDGMQTRCFVNIDGLLGFEIGDLRTGKKTDRVTVAGFSTGPVKRHGCPSHGIAMTPDEKEIWLADGYNECLHVFDLRKGAPVLSGTIKLSDQPGWINFSIDGKYAFPSTGEVISAKEKRIIARLQDEHGTYIQSEKMIEIEFSGRSLVRVGDQFGVGGRR
ncbi:MAG: YncE family protein [Chitinophagales bacterium]